MPTFDPIYIIVYYTMIVSLEAGCVDMHMVLLQRFDNQINQPRSSVIPLSLLCGFLSNEAVLATVLSALARRERMGIVINW